MKILIHLMWASLAFVHTSQLIAEDPPIRIDSKIQYADRQWSWKLFLSGNRDELAEVEDVDFVLPETIYAKRVLTGENINDGFSVNGKTRNIFGSTQVKFNVLAIVSFRSATRDKLLLERSIIASAATTAVKIRNWARRSQDGSNPWTWGIFVDEGKDRLEEIERVRYTLHPTFSQPVQFRMNRNEQFEFRASGWGTFGIEVKVYFKNGSVFETTHSLRFRDMPASRTEAAGLK